MFQCFSTTPVSISQTARICVYYFKYEWFQFWLPSILLFLLINQDFKVGYDALELNKDKYTLNMILNIERWIIILMFPVINVLKLIKCFTTIRSVCVNSDSWKRCTSTTRNIKDHRVTPENTVLVQDHLILLVADNLNPSIVKLQYC